MSNFTAKRRNAGRPAYKRTTVELAKSYADHYGYEMRGGWIYSPTGERIVRGWQGFADQLEQRGAIEAGVGIAHRFGVGDRLLLDERRGERLEITVTRIGRVDIFPVYYFTKKHGDEDMVYDGNCSLIEKPATSQVKIRTSDRQWAEKHGLATEDEGKGDGILLVTVTPTNPQHLTFCGQDMIRFDLGATTPSDWPTRWAQVPATYVVA